MERASDVSATRGSRTASLLIEHFRLTVSNSDHGAQFLPLCVGAWVLIERMQGSDRARSFEVGGP